MKKEHKIDLVCFLVLLLISLALRVVKIDRSFRLDEITTILLFVRGSWLKIVTFVPAPNNHILYSLLAKVSVSVFGEKEWSVRLPALVVGGLTPSVCYLVFRKKFDAATALIASLFLVVHFWMVWFSQDARGYSSFILFSFLSQFLYLGLLQGRGKSAAIGYLAATVVSAYFFFYTGFIIAGQVAFGFFLWVRQRKEYGPRIFILPLGALVISAALYLPAMSGLATYAEQLDRSALQIDRGIIEKSIELVAGSQVLAGAVFVSIIFLVGLSRLWKKWPGFCGLNLLAASLLFLFTLVAQVYLYPRFFCFLIPFYSLGAAEGLNVITDALSARLGKTPSRILRFALALLIFALLGFGLARYYQWGKQGLKDAAKYIEVNHTGRRVLTYGMGMWQFRYYEPLAEPWPGGVKLNPQGLAGSLVVASHPWSWSAEDERLIKKLCTLEKSWPSSGDKQWTVYLFRCFKDGP